MEDPGGVSRLEALGSLTTDVGASVTEREPAASRSANVRPGTSASATNWQLSDSWKS
jgi:hypothetical protein